MNGSDLTPITYAIYVRKSSEYEDKQVQSLVRQTEELRELVDRDGLVVHRTVFEERQSAYRMGRPVFNQLVEMTMKGEVNAWLCWHANRLSRNPVDGGLIVHLMDEGHLDHIRTKDRIYTNSPQDKLMLHIEFGLSKNDSEEKSKIVKSGIRRRNERGYPNGFPPVGFKLAGSTSSSGQSFWEVDKEQFEILRKVFRRFLKGESSVLTLCAYANSIGLRSEQRKKLGGRTPARSAMHRLLTNPVYAGYFHGSGGRRYQLAEGLPRLITEEELESIQVILDGRNAARVKTRRPSAFAALIYSSEGERLGTEHKFHLVCDCRFKFSHLNRSKCPRCGSEIECLQKPRYRSYIYYYSLAARRRARLPIRSIEERKVKALLIDHLRKHIVLPKEAKDWALRYLHELHDEALRNRRKEAEEAAKFKRDIESKRRRVWDLYVDGLITKSEYENEVKTMKALASFERAPDFTLAVDWKEEGRRILDLADELILLLRNGNASEINQAIGSLGIKLIWDGECLCFEHSPLLGKLLRLIAASKEQGKSRVGSLDRLDANTC